MTRSSLLKQPPYTGLSGFYIILLGQLVSALGTALSWFGISVWILQETGSTTAYGIVLVFALLPTALTSIVAGTLVDRWDRRRVLLISDSISALSTLSIALLYLTGQLEVWHIYVAMTVSGVMNAFQAVVPLLVPKERLGRAAGWNQLPWTAAEIIAPAAAGFLLLAVGLGGIFLIDFLTFLIGILSVWLVRIPQPFLSDEAAAARGNLRSEFSFGVRYLWERKSFVYLTAFISWMVFIYGAMLALYPPLILSFADVDTLGLMHSLVGIGSLAGVMLLSFWRIQRKMNGVLGAAVVTGLGCLLIG